MRVLKNLLFVVAFVGLLVGGWFFAARNATPVEIDYLAGRVEAVDLWVALLVCFCAGAAIVAVFAGYQWMKMRFVIRRYRKVSASLEAELHQMRNLPLSDEGSGPSDVMNAPGSAGSAASRGRGVG
ncbi:LapA family protein [Myxococcota bacterium]|nr:LapA family protein [Myxococcota bacterium]